jgi:hypothetical protein
LLLVATVRTVIRPESRGAARKVERSVPGSSQPEKNMTSKLREERARTRSRGNQARSGGWMSGSSHRLNGPYPSVTDHPLAQRHRCRKFRGTPGMVRVEARVLSPLLARRSNVGTPSPVGKPAPN